MSGGTEVKKSLFDISTLLCYTVSKGTKTKQNKKVVQFLFSFFLSFFFTKNTEKKK